MNFKLPTFHVSQNYSILEITNVSQLNKLEPLVVTNVLIKYMARLRNFIAKFPLELISQCDETPVYFVMLSSTTIEFVGAKSVNSIVKV